MLEVKWVSMSIVNGIGTVAFLNVKKVSTDPALFGIS